MVSRWPVLVCGVVLAVCLGGTTVTAQTGAVQGRVTLPRELAPVARRPDVSGLGMPPPRNATPRRRSVVYLELAPREAFEAARSTRATVD